MGLKDLAANAKGASKGNGSKGHRDQVGLTRKVMNQVMGNGLSQAQLIVKSKDDTKFGPYRGTIMLQVDGKEYTFEKGDTHTIWHRHQDVNGEESFTEVFDSLMSDMPPGEKARVMKDCVIIFDGDSVESESDLVGV